MAQAEKELRNEILASFDNDAEEMQRYMTHATWSPENEAQGWKVSPLTGQLQLHESLTKDPSKRDKWIASMAENPEALKQMFGQDAKWEPGTEQKLRDAFEGYENEVIGQQVAVAKETDSFKKFRVDYAEKNPGADDK